MSTSSSQTYQRGAPRRRSHERRVSDAQAFGKWARASGAIVKYEGHRTSASAINYTGSVKRRPSQPEETCFQMHAISQHSPPFNVEPVSPLPTASTRSNARMTQGQKPATDDSWATWCQRHEYLAKSVCSASTACCRHASAKIASAPVFMFHKHDIGALMHPLRGRLTSLMVLPPSSG